MLGRSSRVNSPARPATPATARSSRRCNLGKSALYGPTWRSGGRCLIPARYVVEPSYPDARRDASGKWILGPCVWQRIGVIDRPTMCVAGIWRILKDFDGGLRQVMSMITVNADGHPIMWRMHKSDEEKRSVVILRPSDWEEWLTTPNIEAARAMLQLYPADELVVEPK
ncbi:SOS response-associated peptidase family protein [Burkholderia multivorans]|uniref:SOS response-associated peptidase family protein n=1 Tax=Burkholderia multivorans TaxID=87883 RepID=UPI0009E0D61A|nr:gp33 [Burkholderia multivorans]